MIDKQALIQADRGQPAAAIRLVDKAGFPAWLASLTPGQRSAVEAQKFAGAGYEHAIVPEGDGWSAVGGVADVAALSSWCLARLAERLPPGTYRLGGEAGRADAGKALLGWVTAQYRFARYKPAADAPSGPRVLLTSEVKAIAPVLNEAAAVGWVRDLVNTPAQDMGPAELEDEVRRLGERHKARVTVASGDALARDYPLVHAVGRAAERAKKLEAEREKGLLGLGRSKE